MTSLLGHAIAYAELGLQIFPVGNDKRPLVSQHSATTDLDQIEQWWERWPTALIGHRVAPDVVLLDVDPRHGGKETWLEIRASMNGSMPRTRTHLSGRRDGGGHVWFIRPNGELWVGDLDAWAKERGVGAPRGDDRWTAGIDLLRHEHRYTILPPSPHPETGEAYYWLKGKGPTTEPAPMPELLAALLRRERPEAPTSSEPVFRVADSIADWFSATHTFGQILSDAGWSLVSGDGDSDGSEWRHPAATSSVSATVKHRTLFVYSTSTDFEPTEPGDPHGYTPFKAWATLEHAGDLQSAAAAARTRKRLSEGSSVNGSETSNPPEGSGRGQAPEETAQTAEGDLERVELEHLEAFWGQLAILGQIRDFARARRCSPWAMLGVILARVAAATPPFVVLPPLVGSHLSLNFYVVLIGGSGAGKDAAISAGRDALDLSAAIRFSEVGLGSGEGILDQYVEFKPADKSAGEPARVEQHTESVLFANPEVETVGALKGRSSATLMPMLRDAWMGSGLGFAYAAQERRLSVREHAYRLCLILGAQPTSAGVLLDETAVGTPQRFVWLPVRDPAAPDVAPEPPELEDWHLPAWPPAEDGRVVLELCDEAAEAIDAARLERLRGTSSPDSPSGHDLACQEKIAALLAVLDGKSSVSLLYWSLAGIVATVSRRTREGALSAIGEEERRRNQRRGQAEAQRQEIVRSVDEESAVSKCCKRIKTVLRREGDWVSWNDLRKSVSGKAREYLPDAMEVLMTTGDVIEEERKHRSGVGKVYKLLDKG